MNPFPACSLLDFIPRPVWSVRKMLGPRGLEITTNSRAPQDISNVPHVDGIGRGHDDVEGGGVARGYEIDNGLRGLPVARADLQGDHFRPIAQVAPAVQDIASRQLCDDEVHNI